jgi:hypothetical protein
MKIQHVVKLLQIVKLMILKIFAHFVYLISNLLLQEPNVSQIQLEIANFIMN